MAQSDNSVTSSARTETCEFNVGQIVKYTPPKTPKISHYATIISLSPRFNTAKIDYYDRKEILNTDVNLDTLTCIEFDSRGKRGGGFVINDDIAYTIGETTYNGKYIVKASADDEHYIMYLDHDTPMTAIVKNDTITYITSPAIKATAEVNDAFSSLNQLSNAGRHDDQDKNSQANSIDAKSVASSKPVAGSSDGAKPSLAISLDEEEPLSHNNSGQFNIDIDRNVNPADGYTIQRITGSIKVSGKYNMINLNLNILPGIDEDGRKKMASKISRAIDLILSHSGNDDDSLIDDDSVNDDNSVHAFGERIRDITESYDAANREAAAREAREQYMKRITTPPEKKDTLRTGVVKKGFGHAYNALASIFPTRKLNAEAPATEVARATEQKPESSRFGRWFGSAREGGKLSRKRKRNMTKSKKRKVRTTRRHK
jgi:hypothetical protein